MFIEGDLSYAGISVVTVLSAGIGAFIGSYLKKKAENLATHEDLDKLVEQMKTVTQATKEIETTLSDKAWDRQKRWELKRDTLFQVAKQAFKAKDTAIKLRRYYRPKDAIEAELAGYPPGNESKTTLVNTWEAAKEDLYSSTVLVNLTCGKNLAGEVSSFFILVNDAGCGVLVEGEDVSNAFVNLARQYDKVIDLFCHELKSNSLLTSQSIGSSAAQDPAQPNQG